MRSTNTVQPRSMPCHSQPTHTYLRGASARVQDEGSSPIRSARLFTSVTATADDGGRGGAVLGEDIRLHRVVADACLGWHLDVPGAAATAGGWRSGDRHHASQRDQQQDRIQFEASGHGDVAKQKPDHDRVERNAIDVVDRATYSLGHDLGLEHADRGEVHADAELEHQEGRERQAEVVLCPTGNGVRGHDEAGEATREGNIQPRSGLHAAPKQRRHGGAAHAGHHEQREDHTMRWRNGGAIQGRGPIEDEGEHGALEGRDDNTQKQGALVLPQDTDGILQVVHEARRGITLGIAVILLKTGNNQQQSDDEAQDCEVERATIAAGVEDSTLAQHRPESEGIGHYLSCEAGEDGDAVHDREHHAEHVAQEPSREVVPLRVLRDHPALEAGEEHGCGKATRDAAKHQDLVLLEVLGHAGRNVQEAVHDAALFAAELIRDRADDAAEDHGRAKPCNEQLGDLRTGKAVGCVEGVDIRTLQPVRCHAKRPHREVLHLELPEPCWELVAGSGTGSIGQADGGC
mmetsp:Transcript_147993/g.475186  ORF Transcript_147993/g.475186 Transcript_147993/m.475186 type:complete len:518 (+) Transcript_147993:91-1644(+)